MPRLLDFRAVGFAATGGAISSLSGILFSLAAVSPSTAAVFRCLYALPLLAIVVALERDRRQAAVPRPTTATIACGSILAVDFIFWHSSIDDIGAGLATVLACLGVTIVPLIAWAFLSEFPGRRYFAWLPVIAVGVLLIGGVFEHGAIGDRPVQGAIFGLLAAFAYATFILLLRSVSAVGRGTALPLFEVTLVAGIAGIVLGAPIGNLELIPSWPSAGWLALLAVSSQVIAWLLVARALPRLSAVAISLILMIQPVSGIVFAAIILGEQPSALQLCGVALILVAILGVVMLPGREQIAEEDLAAP